MPRQCKYLSSKEIQADNCWKSVSGIIPVTSVTVLQKAHLMGFLEL